MPTNEMLEDMEFEKHLTDLDDRGLMEFTARQVYDVNKTVSGHGKRLRTLENRDRKQFGISGGIGGIIASAIYALIYFLKGG